MLTKIQKEILQFLQGDLPLISAPYAHLAQRLDVDEDRVIKEIKELRSSGFIRRFGGILNHNKIGLRGNCMCVWKVPKKLINKIARVASRLPQVSHCYLRKAVKDWPYNFYTMVHGRSRTDCVRVIHRIAFESGASDYKMLFTLKQFKKKSPRYEV